MATPLPRPQHSRRATVEDAAEDDDEPEEQAGMHQHRVKIHPILDGEHLSLVVDIIETDFISRDTL